MTRNRIVSVYLTDGELKAVEDRAAGELTDPATWIRRMVVAVADGSARVIAKQREEIGVLTI